MVTWPYNIEHPISKFVLLSNLFNIVVMPLPIHLFQIISSDAFKQTAGNITLDSKEKPVPNKQWIILCQHPGSIGVVSTKHFPQNESSAVIFLWLSSETILQEFRRLLPLLRLKIELSILIDVILVRLTKGIWIVTYYHYCYYASFFLFLSL